MTKQVSDYLHKYLTYIRKTGQVPLPIKSFDDDWEPIGPVVREDLVKAKLIKQKNGGIFLLR